MVHGILRPREEYSSPNGHGYYFYYLKENKVFIDRNGHFLESDYLLQEFSGSDKVLDEIQDTPIKPQTEEPSLSS
ncbi:hypothetical protein Tco_0328324 [Tanacetum coccineum]